MPVLRVIDREGVQHEVPGEVGISLMEVLRELDFGVLAICGGMCSCATCHVYIDVASVPALAAASSEERELLSELTTFTSESRLSCQIPIVPALEGLKVRIAPEE